MVFKLLDHAKHVKKDLNHVISNECGDITILEDINNTTGKQLMNKSLSAY